MGHGIGRTMISVATGGTFDVAESAMRSAGGNLGQGAVQKAQNKAIPAQGAGAAVKEAEGAVSGRRRRFTQTVFTNTLGIGGMANTARRMLLGG